MASLPMGKVGSHVVENLHLNKTLSIVTALIALVAGVWGVVVPSMYVSVASEPIRPGIFSQDLVVILSAAVLLVLALSWKSRDLRKTSVIFGVLGFLFYAYGIYAIEQIYTPLYPLYLATLGLSFYALAVGLASLRRAEIEQVTLPPSLRLGASAFGLVVAGMFCTIWIGQLLPLLETGERIEYTFSVYIIDLVFVMPCFVIAAVLAIRKRALGLIGLPALFVLGVGILSPLALGELIKPARFGQPTDWEGFSLYGGLSAAFVVAALSYLASLRVHAK